MSLFGKIKGFAAIDPAVKPVVTLGPTGVGQRDLTGDDRDFWMQAASNRKPPRARDVATLRAELAGRNPKKYAELNRLIRWAENELMMSHGLLPEDVRWLLP